MIPSLNLSVPATSGVYASCWPVGDDCPQVDGLIVFYLVPPSAEEAKS